MDEKIRARLYYGIGLMDENKRQLQAAKEETAETNHPADSRNL